MPFSIKLGLGGFFTMLMASACLSSTSEPADESTASAAQAVTSGNEYLYFRSNATSWDLNESSRLRSFGDAGSSLVYDVTQPWMTTGGDNGIFVGTDALDGWGTTQTTYGVWNPGATLQVPGAAPLSGTLGFGIQYPSLGRYKVTVVSQAVRIEQASAAESWAPTPNGVITTIAQFPKALDTMLVGHTNGDIFLTFNGRSAKPSWTKVDTWATSGGTFGMPDLAVNAIAYSPADIKTAYVAFAGSKQGHKLWKTGTGGANWVELSSVPLAEIWSISVNPLDSARVYVAGPSGVAESLDYGATWSTNVTPAPLTVPIAAGAKISTVSMIGGDPNVIWVGATNGDVFFTTTGTTTQNWFTASNAALGGMPARMVLHLSGDTATNPPTIIATYDGMYNDSVWVTSNNGFGWGILHRPALPTTPVPLPGIYAFYGVSQNPIDRNVLYIAGTYGAGVTTTYGTTWNWTTN